MASGKSDGISFEIDGDKIFFDINQSPQVRAAVRARAQKIATRAIALDKAESDGTATITLVDRTLANGRAVTEVHSNDTAGEYGTSTRRRRATLRRASAGR